MGNSTSQAVWAEKTLAYKHFRMASIRPDSGISPQVMDLTLPSCQIPRQVLTNRKAHISVAPASTHSSSETSPSAS